MLSQGFSILGSFLPRPAGAGRRGKKWMAEQSSAIHFCQPFEIMRESCVLPSENVKALYVV